MRKITLMAALLGTAYFANAQVGIGTPTPATSAMLEIASTNKGVLIPRVTLSNTKTMLTGNTTQLESLLVYNTATTTTGTDDVTPGFYYWVPLNGSVAAHWERVVNQSQLNEVIENQADIEKIKILLNAAYGSNNLGNSATTGVFGGMVFTPATGTFGQAGYIAPVVEYVKWDPSANGNAGGYVKCHVPK